MNSKSLTILLSIATLASLILLQPKAQKQIQKGLSQFETWKDKHKISFSSSLENAYRQKLFFLNKAKINKHNSRTDKTYQMGLNQFSALTQEEFQQTYLSLIIEPQQIQVLNHQNDKPYLMEDVDWTVKGAVTQIKDQGQCGSCWAFSATGALQGLSKIAYGSLKSFSEQQLVDCSDSYGNQGCNGGLMNSAFKYVKDRGISLQNEYPYKAVRGSCKKNSGSFKISGLVQIKTCSQLAVAISARPISVAVDASNWSTYSSGVFNECDSFLNHGVLLVGGNDKYWKIKNSWGTSWGQNGYMRLMKGNTCGICNAASYPQK